MVVLSLNLARREYGRVKCWDSCLDKMVDSCDCFCKGQPDASTRGHTPPPHLWHLPDEEDMAAPAPKPETPERACHVSMAEIELKIKKGRGFSA